MAMPEKKKSMTLLSPNLLLFIFIFIFILMPTAFSQSMFPCTSKNKPLILPQLNKPNGPYTYDHMELSRWFSSKSPLKGVALLVHGLNNKPSSMNPLALHFSSLGYLVLRGSLRGHRGSLKENKKVSINQWREDIDLLHCLAYLKSREERVPFIVNCYSMSCLLFLDLMKRRKGLIPKTTIQKAIFISPAFKVKPELMWLSQILKFLPSDLMIPSSNIRSYRSQSGTSVSSYKAFFQLLTQNLKLSLIKPKGPPFPQSLILINPKDELLDSQGIKQLIQTQKKRLPNRWKIIEIENKQATTIRQINHLLLDEASLGKEKWNQWKEHISLFLKRGKPVTLY